MVDPNLEPLDTESLEQITNHESDLAIGGHAAGTDRVEVALGELAEAAGLRVLTPPDRSDVIALERQAQRRRVLAHKASERDCEIEAQRDVAPAGVGEAEQLLADFGSVFHLGQQYLGVFERRCVDGVEAVAAKNPSGRLHELLARDH